MRAACCLVLCLAVGAIFAGGCAQRGAEAPPPAPGGARSPAPSGQGEPSAEKGPAGLGLPVYANAQRAPAEDRAEAKDEAQAEIEDMLQGAPIDKLRVDAFVTDDDWQAVARWFDDQLGKEWERHEGDMKQGFIKANPKTGELWGISVAHHSATGRTAIGYIYVKSKALKEKLGETPQPETPAQ